jgi:hypothetical protein
MKAFFQDGSLFEELMLDLAEHCCSMNVIVFIFFVYGRGASVKEYWLLVNSLL